MAAMRDKIETTVGCTKGENNQFERILQYPDITAIDIYHKDIEEPTEIIMPWVSVDSRGEENINQKSYINKFGDLFVVIDEDGKANIENAFNLTGIEDKERMDFMWEMLDIKDESCE
ncbi:hypothetical protein PRVXH_001807 [Proteinivorax hydrogeniformans]|uniref:Uncharacterized protein n=1 Tax=Proteinivorax hydrogeniformans TaxID=1826727 RepID=A0AAU8HQS5_9FIRM